MFEVFLRKILKREIKSGMSPEKSLWIHDLKLIRIAALVVLGISAYWLIADQFLDSYNLAPISRIGVWAQAISAIYMFFLPTFSRRRPDRLVRFSFVAFYIIIIAGVCILTLMRNIDIQATGDSSPYIGVSVSTFYLFILSFMPLPKLSDTILIVALMAVGLVSPDIFVLSSAYSLLSHIVLCTCFGVSSFFFRNVLLGNATHEIDIESLSGRLFNYSICDSLTTILNRRAMDHYINYLLENPEVSQVGVIFFDIDYFKKYNDHYGHVKGDEALKQVAITVQNALGTSGNSFLFRYGGEEFIAMVENADKDRLLETMALIRDAVFNADIPREDISMFNRITITVGGSIEEVPNASGDYVIAADNQLYIGKNSFRNAIYFEDNKIDIGSAVPRNVLEYTKFKNQDTAWFYENDFSRAMAAREFVVYCQPKYDTFAETPVGGEALVRWQRQDGTLVPPGEFIPVFEADGLITRLDEYVFSVVCQRQKALADSGMKVVPVSVNMSRATLFSPGTVKRYLDIAESIGVQKDLVPIELTESTEADGDIIKKLTVELKELGFSICMDDFGAGYFSLSNLSSLPFDVVKLDKALIDGIGQTNGDEILKHIIEISHFLNMTVVAEGVENENQLNFLKKLNCDAIQGFYFSRPVPFDDYLKLVTSPDVQAVLESTLEHHKDLEDVGSLRVTNDLRNQYLAALGSVYMTIHVVDLKHDTTVEFATTVNVREHVNKTYHACIQMQEVMKHTVSPGYIDDALEFTDLTTIKQRLKGKRSISRDFVGVHFGWFQAQFIEVSADENGDPEVIIFTTKVVEADKRKEERLLAECRTDELTGVLNRRAFNEDCNKILERFAADSASASLAVMIVETNDVSLASDRFGHMAGDELIWGTTEILMKIFGSAESIYRLGSVSFAVIFNASDKKIPDISSAFDNLANKWIGNNISKLSASYGFALKKDFPELDIQGLINEADAQRALKYKL